MIPKPKKSTNTSNEDDDYVDIEDDEDDDEDDEIIDTEEISPEKLQEFLNNKSIQKIFQGFDQNLCIKRGKNKYEVDDEYGSEYTDEDEKSCYTPSSESSSNDQSKEEEEEGTQIETPACVMHPKKVVEEDKKELPAKEIPQLSQSLQMKRLEKNNQDIIKSKIPLSND